MPQRAMDGGAAISMDGMAVDCSGHKLHFLHPCRSYAVKSHGWRCGDLGYT